MILSQKKSYVAAAASGCGTFWSGFSFLYRLIGKDKFPRVHFSEVASSFKSMNIACFNNSHNSCNLDRKSVV